MDLKEYILKDREFLHEISNYLVVIQACARHLERTLDVQENNLSEKEMAKLTKLNSSVENMLASLKSRKQFVSQYK